MSSRKRLLIVFLITLFFAFLAGCAAPGVEPRTPLPSPAPTEFPAATETVPPAATPTSPGPTPTEAPYYEEREIELEWPAELRLGDSDIIRLSLIPSSEGYKVQVEFPDHTAEVEPAEVPYIPGYSVLAIARLDAAGFDFEPKGQQVQALIQDVPISWHWTIYPESAGRHRMSVLLNLRWIPQDTSQAIKEVAFWQKGIEVQVNAPFGLSVPQARAVGIAGVLVGGLLALPLAEFAARQRAERNRASRVRRLKPNRSLVLDKGPGVTIADTETQLLQALFGEYERISIDKRYFSGYSGARTFLVQPVRHDGRTDAYVIVKIGSQSQIQAEYANYETFVRHTLPPITSRVLGPPVVVSDQPAAALEYTFVGTPDTAPVSLREYALSNPAAETAELIEGRLFSTFGPAWWMQRIPYHFTMGQEYDKLLPVHLLLEIAKPEVGARLISGDSSQLPDIQPGDVVRLSNAVVMEVRPSRRTATLTWSTQQSSSVRVRFQEVEQGAFYEGQSIRECFGSVVATRADLLRWETAKAFPDVNLLEETVRIAGRTLPNPLIHLNTRLSERLQGTSSVIHGDLNLENVLVGPGELVWLIDFAATREGHTLFDFARLEAELTTQVVAEKFAGQGLNLHEFLTVLERLEDNGANLPGELGEAQQLLAVVRRTARRCLYDPTDLREFRKALILSYLGTLKFSNLDEVPTAPIPKALAYSAAAYLSAID